MARFYSVYAGVYAHLPAYTHRPFGIEGKLLCRPSHGTVDSHYDYVSYFRQPQTCTGNKVFADS
jgi:hypothetical protein